MPIWAIDRDGLEPETASEYWKFVNEYGHGTMLRAPNGDYVFRSIDRTAQFVYQYYNSSREWEQFDEKRPKDITGEVRDLVTTALVFTGGAVIAGGAFDLIGAESLIANGANIFTELGYASRAGYAYARPYIANALTELGYAARTSAKHLFSRKAVAIGLSADFGSQSFFNIIEGKNVFTNYNFVGLLNGVGKISYFSDFASAKYSITFDEGYVENPTSGAIANGIISGFLGQQSSKFPDLLGGKGNEPIVTGVEGFFHFMSNLMGGAADKTTDQIRNEDKP